MKKIAFLLLLILVNISAYAQEDGISDIEKKEVVFGEQLKNRDFTFESISFELDHNKIYTKKPGFARFTDLFQDSKEYAGKDFFSVGVEKKFIENYTINSFNYNVKDYADGFPLVKWKNKKDFEMNISLGGKCGF